MKTIISFLVVSAIVIVFGYMMFVEVHGRSAEIEEGKLHENCEICNVYRTLNIDNAEFQLRELNRK